MFVSGHKHFPALRVTKGMRGEGSAQLWLRHRELVGAGMGAEGGWGESRKWGII